MFSKLSPILCRVTGAGRSAWSRPAKGEVQPLHRKAQSGKFQVERNQQRCLAIGSSAMREDNPVLHHFSLFGTSAARIRPVE